MTTQVLRKTARRLGNCTLSQMIVIAWPLLGNWSLIGINLQLLYTTIWRHLGSVL